MQDAPADATSLNHMRENPKFLQLITRRSRLSWSLAVVLLALYLGFVAIAVTVPASFLAPIVAGSTLPWSVLVGTAVIVLSFLITGVYVHRANTEYDRLTRQIIAEAGR